MCIRDSTTASEIIRRAITTYFELENARMKITPDVTKIYTDFLSDGEHMIVDIEHWTAIWEELNEKASDRFWEIIKKSGYEHGMQYRDKGLTDVYDILRYMEVGNYFRIKIDGEGRYTLILSTHTEQRFLKTFLENLCLKANLFRDCWKSPDVKIYKFYVVAFAEERPYGKVRRVI